VKVTQINVRPWLGPQPAGKNSVMASATIEIDGNLVIERVRVIAMFDGRRLVAMPSVRNGNGSFTDVVRPANKDVRNAINEAVLAEIDLSL